MELNKELLKGHIDTLILSILSKEDSYGYEIAKIVKEKTSFELKDSTMYVSLKRLESKEFIKSYYVESTTSSTRRKYYHLTSEGIKILDLKKSEWNFIKDVMAKFLD